MFSSHIINAFFYLFNKYIIHNKKMILNTIIFFFITAHLNKNNVKQDKKKKSYFSKIFNIRTEILFTKNT